MRRILILLLLFVFSCADREVQLPHTSLNTTTSVLDISPIYIFYDEQQPTGADFNRQNMIGSTNWLVNIDKRLNMKQLWPHLQYLYKKRHDDGMHANPEARIYLTCFNPEIGNLSFIDITQVNYMELSTYSSSHNSADRHLIRFVENADDENALHQTHIVMSHAAYLSELRSILDTISGKPALLFPTEMTYQAYIDIQTEIQKSKGSEYEGDLVHILEN